MSGPDDPLLDWQQSLVEAADHIGLDISRDIAEACRRHLDLILRDNARAGLTAVTDPAGTAIKHVLDSLTGLLLQEIAPGQRVADVGSGAGFPGLVLAIARPHAAYTLIESNRRKAGFISDAARALGLDNVTVIADRAEEVGHQPKQREAYGLVLSRAVAPLPVLLEYCLPLARLGGRAIAYKGPGLERELHDSAEALATLGGRIADTRAVSLPQGMGERVLVLIEKTSPTPARYPRRPGIPAKRPLGPSSPRTGRSRPSQT